ncbi:MAG: hypothetical protein JST67_05955 [Bacteroidetes bacterium]|nr:hypothetical protein [Bacteroidota bacterium]
MHTYCKILLCFFSCLSAWGQSFNKKNFYDAIKSTDSTQINQQIALVQQASIKEKQAYIGALFMKKAGVITSKSKKIHSFSHGKESLEAAIQKDSSNAEYHFLRLIIQEQAPAFLGYHKQLQEDKTYIKKHFNTMPYPVQQFVKEYSKQSNTLRGQYE